MSHDIINSPAHYKAANGMESIDVIEVFGLGFRLGNVVKYILRAGKKGDRLEDLKKARWYLDREIQWAEQGEKPADDPYVTLWGTIQQEGLNKTPPSAFLVAGIPSGGGKRNA